MKANEKNFGLSHSVLSQLKTVLENEEKIEKAVIFGSRALGNYKKGSDIDIALMGKLDRKDRDRIFIQLNEYTTIPHKIDIVLYNEKLNPELKEHIDRYGIQILLGKTN